MPQHKKKGPAWGRDLGSTFGFVRLVHRFRLYQPFVLVPPGVVEACGHLFSRLFFPRNSSTRKKLGEYIDQFTDRHHAPKIRARLVDLTLRNMGALLFDVAFKLPGYRPSSFSRVVQFSGKERLDAALAGGNGAIVVSLHVGQFFYMPLALAMSGHYVAAVANEDNRRMFEILAGRPDFRNVHVVFSASYAKLQERLVAHLRANHIVILMHDVGSGHHLKVPMFPGKAPILVGTPQGALALHHETGAPIIPVVNVPRERFTASTVTFLDPSPIKNACLDAENARGKKFHGQASLEINGILYPFARKYITCWQALLPTGNNVFRERLRFAKGTALNVIISSIHDYLTGLIYGSYEPGRDDGALLAWIEDVFSTASRGVTAARDAAKFQFAIAHPDFVQLAGRDATSQARIACSALARLLARAGLENIAGLIRQKLADLPCIQL